MNDSKRLAALALLVAFVFQPVCADGGSGADDADTPDRVTTVMIIEQGRPFVDLALSGLAGKTETVRFLVDTGGGAFIIPESQAKAIGLEWSETFRSEGREFARPTSTPQALLGRYPLPLVAERVLIAIGREPDVYGTTGLFPGHLLAQHHVIFDYPGRSLTLAPPGSMEPQGESMPMPVSQPMGFPRTEIEVAGETHGMLLDTGPPATIISEAVMQAWANARPEWQHDQGARGKAGTLAEVGGQVLATMVIENVSWAGHTLDTLTVASQRKGVFEEYMSGMMTAPVVGALASNAFMNLRLELDYLNETLYVTRSGTVGKSPE